MARLKKLKFNNTSYEFPVEDVKINTSSIVSNGIATIPVDSTVTQWSTNLVTSGAVESAIGSVVSWVSSVNGETWAVTLDADDISDSSTTNKFVTTSEKSTWNWKQDALSTQTAYTSKGSATKVPQITTNTLWQVTWITEVTITQPDISWLVTGPASSVNWHMAVFDGTTWKVVKDGGAPVTSVNNNTGAVTVTEFLPSGTPSTGDVVTKTANGYAWQTPQSWLPSGGTEWQILMIVNGNPTWVTPVNKGFIMLDPNSPMTIKYLRVGAQSTYEWLSSYSNETRYDTI